MTHQEIVIEAIYSLINGTIVAALLFATIAFIVALVWSGAWLVEWIAKKIDDRNPPGPEF